MNDSEAKMSPAVQRDASGSAAVPWRVVKRAVGLVASFLCGAACSAVAFAFVSRGETYSLPQSVLLETRSPSGRQAAQILEARRGGGNYLGSGRRFYLAVRRGETTCVVTRELSDGFGTYEGGVAGLRWRDDRTVVLERTVADRRADLAFNTDAWEWTTSP